MNKIDKPLVRCRLWKTTEKPQITKIRNKSGDITADSTEIKRIVREYCEQLFVNTLDNLDEMDKSLETQNLPKLYYEEILKIWIDI